MPIYTKKGDRGVTSIYKGTRVSKADSQVEAYGSVDELEAFIGLLIVKIKSRSEKEFLSQIQKNLYIIKSYLAGEKQKSVLKKEEVEKIEKYIDKEEQLVPKLTRFILQQGSEASCLFHVVRTVCRRAERAVVRFTHETKRGARLSKREIVLKYLNRLSDLFFIMARKYNKGGEKFA